MRRDLLLAFGCAGALVGGLIWLGLRTAHAPPAPFRLYPDTPTFKIPPADATSDLFYFDFIRKDNASTNRLETGVFLHFEPLSPATRAFKNLKFIQILRRDDGTWRIDENPYGTRVALPHTTNPGSYPCFPRQFIEPTGIYLYDRPGHGPDRPPVMRWTLTWRFPFNTRTLFREIQSRTFSQNFECCVAGITDGKYQVLGGVKWSQQFRDGVRISDNFGPFVPPPNQISGATDFFAPSPPSPEFTKTLREQAPALAPP